MSVRQRTNSHNDPPLVSVIIPLYNARKYILDAIQSVEKQTYKHIEVLISDDHSTDDSLKIVKEYCLRKKKKNIRIVQTEKNIGCCRNINYLLLRAKGEYIKPLIHDDILHPDCIRRFLSVFESHPRVGLVTSYQQFAGRSRDIRGKSIIPFSGLVRGIICQKALIEKGNWIGGETAVMFRKNVLLEGLWNPEWKWIVDQDMWIRILKNWDLFVVPKVLTYSRIHSNQATVYLNKPLAYSLESLQFLRTVFLNPQIYGIYEKEFQYIIIKNHLESFIHEAFQTHRISDLNRMISVGSQTDWLLFWTIFIKMLLYQGKNWVYRGNK